MTFAPLAGKQDRFTMKLLGDRADLKDAGGTDFGKACSGAGSVRQPFFFFLALYSLFDRSVVWL